jgi:hypothetical protein
MEYRIMADKPFQEIETQTLQALQCQGFIVRRTFSLNSATAETSDDARPGLSVLMLYGDGLARQPLGVLSLYGQAGQIVLKAMLSSPTPDTEAELVAALTLTGLDFCVHTGRGAGCIGPEIARTDEDIRRDLPR